MLEHIGADVDELFADLTVGRVSAWQQYALGFCGTGDETGNVYYVADISDPAAPRVILTQRGRQLAQVFRHARLGAVRVGAATDRRDVRTVAFRNPDRRLAVAIATRAGATVTVRGLPAGRYAVTYGSRDTTAAALPDVVATPGSAVTSTMPVRGVLTLVGP